MGQEKITGNFALDIGQAKLGYLFTLKIANSSLTDHYNALELVQYLNFRLGILSTLTANQKYKLTFFHTTVPKLSTKLRTEAENITKF